ncbi:hypothetical protein D7030_11585 [Flavobacteriaceae bacterium AU392]|nr:hypothetical protein D7030_11585 [Flavobacteriaceae bacterium AU392]
MKQYKIIIALVCLIGFNLNAQQKLEKTKQTVSANKDVTLNLNTSYTNIEIESWSKNEIQVEAYIESKELSKEDLQKILENWDVDIDGFGSNVTISTKGSGIHTWNDLDLDLDLDHVIGDAMKDLKIVISDFPEIPEIPEVPGIPEMPHMPNFPDLPDLPKGVHNFNFDFDEYKKDGDSYLKKWKKEYEEEYGKEYSDEMEAWAKEFAKTDFDAWSKEMEVWGEKFGKKFEGKWAKDMEKWGEKLGKRFENSDWLKNIEKWGDEFEDKYGKDIEVWAEKFAEQFEDENGDFQREIRELVERVEDLDEEGNIHRNNRVIRLNRDGKSLKNNKVIKTIKIKMPKDTKLKVNVRHGELKFASVVHNLNADLSHSLLLAVGIDGGETSIDASYSTIEVDNWNLGELKLNYGENTHLKRVNKLRLNSNSSNITVGELTGNAIINGSFGDLEINSISNSFKNLNLILENTDAIVQLPKSAYNLEYQGNRTRFSHPDKKAGTSSSSFSKDNSSTDKTIIINAKYSNVIMQ